MSLLLLLSDDGPSPSFSANFMSGSLPAGLTYTNSSTTRYYWNSSGSLATAAANEPIFEYDPLTLALKGMRWEMEQRTNDLLYSSENNAVWGVSNCGKASATSVVPDKSAILCTTSSAGGFIRQNVGTFSGGTEVAWAILEQGTGAESVILVYNDTTPAVVLSARLVWATMAASVFSGSGAVGVTLLKNSGPNGGKLALLWANYGSTPGHSRSIRYYPAGTGSGTGILHHAQREAASYPSSPIVTTSAAVIRQPDVLTAMSLSPWYNQAEGTIVFEGVSNETVSSTRALYVFSDGTSNERLGAYVGVTQSSFFAVDGGVAQADLTTLGANAALTVFRHAGAYKVNDFAASLRGGSVATDLSGTLPTVNQLRLGVVNPTGASAFMGYARRFDYYRTRFPDATIQGLSRV